MHEAVLGVYCDLYSLAYRVFESITDMMERIGDHLTYLSKYAIIGSVQEVRKQCLIPNKSLVAAYCDLLGFYVKVRGLFFYHEGKSRLGHHL